MTHGVAKIRRLYGESWCDDPHVVSELIHDWLSTTLVILANGSLEMVMNGLEMMINMINGSFQFLIGLEMVTIKHLLTRLSLEVRLIRSKAKRAASQRLIWGVNAIHSR